MVAELSKHGRRSPFRVPVAIKMHFSVSVRQSPPYIESLPKNYLDLLQEEINSRKLLLQDDRLVHALFCSYSFSPKSESKTNQPFMTFEVETLTNFVRDLQLYQRIASGHFNHLDGISQLRIKHPHDDYDSSVIRDYDRWHQMGDEERAQFGEQQYKERLFRYQQLAQRELLKRQEPGPMDLAALYSPLVRKKRKYELFQQSEEALAAGVRNIYSRSEGSADLGSLPAKKGESEQFQRKMLEKLDKMLEEYPVFNPLLTPIGITIFYIPSQETSQPKSLNQRSRDQST